MPLESVFLRNARRLAQMGLAESKKDKAKIDLEYVTATQAEKFLKVSRSRIEAVLPEVRRLENARVGHYDISVIVEIVNNTHNLDIDEHYYVLAEKQLEFLQSEAEPTPQQLARYEMGWASNAFRNPHYLPKFSRSGTVKEILRKALLRAVVWCDDKFIQGGLRYYDLLAYGDLAEDYDVTKCICLKIALPECPENMEVSAYRQVIIDQLLMEPESIDQAFHTLDLIGDGALYRRKCPQLQKRLQEIWDTEEELQQWLDKICETLPGITDQQIEDQIKNDLDGNCPIVRRLSLQQKIAFEGEFGDLIGLTEDLKRLFDQNYWKKIPNKYNIPEEQWSLICKKGLKGSVREGNSDCFLIKGFDTAKLFGYRVRFGKKLRFSYGYKEDGTRLSLDELQRIKSRLHNLGINIETGDLVRVDIVGFKSVTPQKLFEGVMKGDVGDPPESIVRSLAKYRESQRQAAEARRIAQERRKEKKREKNLQRRLRKQAKAQNNEN